MAGIRGWSGCGQTTLNTTFRYPDVHKAGKPFTMEFSPNRCRGISKGRGTTLHLDTLLTMYLSTHMPPRGR